MSYTIDGGNHRLDCDGPGCRANYEMERSEGTLKDAVAGAKTEGWVAVPLYTGSVIEKWEHFCRDCKRELGDD